MPTEKRSALDILGIPKEFGVLLLSAALVLAASPYLGGTDFGAFKVPAFSPGMVFWMRMLGPVLLCLVSLLFLPRWRRNDGVSITPSRAVDTDSKYHLQSVADIVKAEVASHGIHIDGLRINDRFHINDLERMCAKTFSPGIPAEDVHDILQAARAKAFTSKYAVPKEDEKLADVASIKIDGLRPWDAYFMDLLRDLGAKDLNQLDILYVGIGNGHSDEAILSKIHAFRAVDISEEALRYARKKYPQMESSIGPAEDLKGIPNNSVDFYLSLRTYQSTLFDRRTALHEAYRVLRNGGIIALSVPIMYLRKDGTVLRGLIPPASTEPNMEYARQLVERIAQYLRILNFQDVATDERSPFEIFLTARR